MSIVCVLHLDIPAHNCIRRLQAPGEEILTPTRKYYEFATVDTFSSPRVCIILRRPDGELEIPSYLWSLWRERGTGELGFGYGGEMKIAQEIMPSISTFSMSELEQAQDMVNELCRSR